MNGPVPGICWWNALEEWRRQRETSGARRVEYVEGWGVRQREGRLEAFEHGWVEVYGEVIDVTPDNQCLRYFAALRFEDPEALYERRIFIPFYRSLVCPQRNDERNPFYDAEAALRYAAAKREADTFCLEGTP